MKLKDYVIPQYGQDDGLGEDLQQYSLKNFDLNAYQLPEQPQPDPAAFDPYLLKQETDSPSPLAAAREPASPNQPDLNAWSPTGEQPNEQSFAHAPTPTPTPAQTEWNQPAPTPWDVQFGPHFNLQTVSYTSMSPAQAWKIPRWVVTTVGLFFGSAAVLTLACCVVLLRDAKPAPTAESAVPTAAVATTSAAPAQPSSSTSPLNQAPSDVARAASTTHYETTANGRAAVRHSGAATATAMRDDSSLARRVVVSRHPGAVRRPVYRPRRVASNSEASSAAPQETETASRRPPQDALDKLLSESSL